MRVRGTAHREAPRAVLQTKAGAPLERDIVTADIRRLYELGTFEDVRAVVEEGPLGPIVTFHVEPRPRIARIRYDGNERFTTAQLIAQAQLKAGGALDRHAVQVAVERITDGYRKRGNAHVQVTWKAVTLPGGEVEIVVTVDEGPELSVRRVQLAGNEALTDERLRSVMGTAPRGFWSWVTGTGKLVAATLDEDVRRLREVYLDEGFIDARIGPVRTAIVPGTPLVDVVVPIEEGPRFTVGRITWSGTPPGLDARLLARLPLRSGRTFRRSELLDSLVSIRRDYRSRGHAFVRIDPTVSPDRQTRAVDVTVEIDPGPVATVGERSVVGNESTRDGVVLRDLSLTSGDRFDGDAIDHSRATLRRLPFLATAHINESVGDAPNIVDLAARVVEKDAFRWGAGGGVSGSESWLVLRAAHHNLFGLGQAAAFRGRISALRQELELSLLDPRVLDTRLSAGAQVSDLDLLWNGITRRQTGGSLRLGYPLTSALSAGLVYELVDKRWEAADVLSTEGRVGAAQLTLSLDLRDDRVRPTFGHRVVGAVRTSAAVLGSDFDFTGVSLSWSAYQPLPLDTVLRASLRYGRMSAATELPVFERLFLGGIRSVRGFERESLGPRLSDGTPIGGEELLAGSLELRVPIMAGGRWEGVAFLDAGQAFCASTDCASDPTLVTEGSLWGDLGGSLDAMGVAWGLGLRMHLPGAPLRFECGFPWSPRATEPRVVCELAFGSDP